jgi:CelD/BcsL family acetyltransferase involved in cellulose biosynthesis
MGRLILRFTPIGLENSWVSLYILEIEGTAVAFEYFLRFNNRYSLIRCDYDRDYSYYSPGNSLRLLALRDMLCFNQQVEYDLGGDAYSYKLEWAERIRPHLTLTVGNKTAKGRIVMMAKNTIIPYVRSCREYFTGDSC